MIPTLDEFRAEPAVVPAAPADPLQRVLCAVAMDPSKKFGSAEEQLFLIAREFRARGGLFLPLYLCPPGSKALAFEQAGLPNESLDLRRFRWSSLWKLLGLIRRHRFEVIHWHFTQPLKNPYLWWLTVLKPTLRHYYTDHISRDGPEPRARGFLKRAFKRQLMKRYGKVVCVSRFVRECYPASRKWANLHCFLHFINTQRFRPDAETRTAVRARHGAGGQFVVLTVAHLIKPKGVDVAVRALAELPDSAVLWVVGDGEEAGDLKKLAGRLGVAGRVKFLGLQQCVEPFMQAADCFVCPSLWAEAAGLVNLEANACGLPVIASRIGGIPEYVSDGETGFLFPPGDAGQLAERIGRLQQDRQLCRTLGVQARTRAVAYFSAEQRLNDYLDFYRLPT
jgi:glycosyltransferase involved in cell wall biosynthesis